MLGSLLHLLGMVVERQIAKRGVQTDRIVEAMDVAGDGIVGRRLGDVYAGGVLVFERREAAGVLANSPLAYWLPRSEWKITPGATGEVDQALRNA